MKTELGTNQAIWSVEFSNKYGRRIYLRHINEDDWVYEDEDRIYELFAEINKDKSNLGKAYREFCEYSGGHLNMTDAEIDTLHYLLAGLNWIDIRYCVDILDNDVKKDIHEFLIKYNFRIYIDEMTIS